MLVCEVCGLIWLALLGRQQARHILHVAFPELQAPYEEGRSGIIAVSSDLQVTTCVLSYAAQCDLSVSNVLAVALDFYSFAHAFGWFVIGYATRDVGLCVVLSVLHELLEQVFKHILPNFHECWFDR